MPQATVEQQRTDSFPGWGAVGPLSRAGLVWALIVALLLLVKALPIHRESGGGRGAAPIIEAALLHESPDDARALLFFRPMDLNAASCEELTALPRVGYVTANSIIEYRRDVGFLLSTEELAWPEGPLSPFLMGVLGPYVTVGLRDGSMGMARKDRSEER